MELRLCFERLRCREEGVGGFTTCHSPVLYFQVALSGDTDRIRSDPGILVQIEREIRFSEVLDPNQVLNGRIGYFSNPGYFLKDLIRSTSDRIRKGSEATVTP